MHFGDANLWDTKVLRNAFKIVSKACNIDKFTDTNLFRPPNRSLDSFPWPTVKLV